MKASTISFKLRMKEACELPQFKGPMLRGAYGYALRSLCCDDAQQDCAECEKLSDCIYSLLFETDKVTGRSAPPPFVLNPALEMKTFYSPQDELNFEMTFLGPAVNHLNYLVGAGIRVAERGLGKSRGKAFIDIIQCYKPDGAVLIYVREQGFTGKKPEPYDLDELPENPDEERDLLSIELTTPLKLKMPETKKQIETHQLNFKQLIKALMGRVSTLAEIYAEGAPDWPYRRLLEQAAQVRTLNPHNPSKGKVKRFSTRQMKQERIPGIMGILHYQGTQVAQYRRLIKLGEILHLGSRTSFGFGQYRALWFEKM